jgi:hypothetical protein
MMMFLRNKPTGVALALAILFLLLVQPNHPGAMTWGALLLVPLELPAIVAALIAFGTSRGGTALRAGITVVLTTLTVLKTGDFAMFSALSRGFNPVADLFLIKAGLHLIAGTVGTIAAVLLAIAAVALVGVILALAWWATGTLARLAPPAPRNRLIAATAAATFTALCIADIGAVKGWNKAFNPPGSAFTARVGVERVAIIRATLADLALFRTAAQTDPFAATPGLLNLIDRDVIVVFVESYGRTSIDTPYYADLHRATLLAGQARLEQAGLAMASGYLASPTMGGQSWLAHSTTANGLWINDQIRYRAALISGRKTLFHFAQEAGFQTAAVMPQITMDWPESATMGFDRILAAKDLGYKGLPFNWIEMPDQFTFAALDRLLLDQPSAKPRFVQLATGSSHAPWVPVPQMIGWDDIGDGTEFNAMASAGDPPDVVWRNNDRVRAQYRLAIDYALQTVLSYAERHADNPPLMIVLGDHQAAGFVALDQGRDVPIHIIGPTDLVARTAAFAPHPGLVPPPNAPTVAMDQLRDLVLRAFTTLAP